MVRTAYDDDEDDDHVEDAAINDGDFGDENVGSFR